MSVQVLTLISQTLKKPILKASASIKFSGIDPSIFVETSALSHISSSDSFLLSAINAWSVSGQTLDSNDIAASFFAVSLFPWLAMLYYLQKSNTPRTAFFGFCFLLVFVFATIPAGIYAKYEYHDILANVDWLHGLAESLLTITNLLIIAGFRQTRSVDKSTVDSTVSNKLNDLGPSILGAFSVLALVISSFVLSPHIEPSNALSLPTWIVHTSSIIEWIIALALVWDHAITSGNPRWRGMAMSMIPSHASGLCACTFHLFYNNPSMYWIVALQAALTAFGNTCMAAAAYRVYDFEKKRPSTESPAERLSLSNEQAESEAVVSVLLSEQTQYNGQLSLSSPPSITQSLPLPLPQSNFQFSTELVVKSVAAAAVVKYGELFFDFPFSASDQLALAMVTVPELYLLGTYLYLSTKLLPSDDNTKLASNNNANII